ncbi:MAG: hypothetical protein ACBR14_29340 [Microcoleus sp.]
MRNTAVSVSLSADTAAAEADGAIAHSAPGSDYGWAGAERTASGPVAQLVRAHA